MSAWTTSTSTPPPRAASWWSTRRRRTSTAPPSTRSRCCWRPRARSRRRRHAARAHLEAVVVLGHRDLRQDRRRGRARPHRAAGGPAARRVRHAHHWPTTRTCRRPAPRSWASNSLTLDELLGRADFISVHLPKTQGDGGPDRQGGPGQDQAGRHHRQRRPRRADRRGRRSPTPSPAATSAAPASTCSPPSRAPTARCSSCRRWW